MALIAVLALVAPAAVRAQVVVTQVDTAAPVEPSSPDMTSPDVIIVTPPVVAPPPPVIVGQPQIVVVPPPVVIVPPVVASPQPVAPVVITGGTTEVVIRAREGESSLPISVLHTGPGEDADQDGYDPLCTTPCTVLLPPGQYELLAGDHRTFEVTASGGRQDWEVEDDGLGGIVAGVVLAFSGPLGLSLPGMALLTLDWGNHDNDEHLGLGYGLIGAGAALGVLGMLLWIESTGGADLVSSTADGPALGLNLGGAVLVPSFGVAPGENGDVAWGLGFALSL